MPTRNPLQDISKTIKTMQARQSPNKSLPKRCDHRRTGSMVGPRIGKGERGHVSKNREVWDLTNKSALRLVSSLQGLVMSGGVATLGWVHDHLSRHKILFKTCGPGLRPLVSIDTEKLRWSCQECHPDSDQHGAKCLLQPLGCSHPGFCVPCGGR